MDGPVYTLAVSGTTLYAGGDFTSAGGVPANHIAAWDGNNWHSLGSGTDGAVFALAAHAGSLYVGGWFTGAGGEPTPAIAVWSGSSWSTLGSGLDGGPPGYPAAVRALAVSGYSVYAGGWFSIAGGHPSGHFAIWQPPPPSTPTPTPTPTATPNPVCDLQPGQTQPQLASRPSGYHSMIGTQETAWLINNIQDDTFAQWILSALAPGGTSHAREAIFLFQPCFGGGMVDALQVALNTSTLRWVGGSASRYDEPARLALVQGTPVGGFWTLPLALQLQSPNETTLSALATAAARDQAHFYGTPETGQWASGNAGQTVSTSNSCAPTHYAILWGGAITEAGLFDNVAQDSYSSIASIRQALLNAWAGQASDIRIFFNDGTHNGFGGTLPQEWHAHAATEAELHETIDAIGAFITSNDQFVFYSTGHGASWHPIFFPGPHYLTLGDEQTGTFSLTAEELTDLQTEPMNGESVHLDFDGMLDNSNTVAVSLNGLPLGYLQQGTQAVDFSVPLTLLAENNQLVVQSINSTSVTITSGGFSSGPLAGQEVSTDGGTVTPTPSSTTCPVQYADVPPSQPFYPFVRTLACRGIIAGYADDTFRPFSNVTRGQVTKFVVNAASLSDPIPDTQQTFADVPPSHPFWLYIERLAARGNISGYSCGGAGEPCDAQNRPYFRPGANLTRGQLAKIVANTAGYAEAVSGQLFEDVPATSPFYPYIERMALHGVISGYGCGAAPAGPCLAPGNRPYFATGNDVTRGQTAKIVANAFCPGAQTP